LIIAFFKLGYSLVESGKLGMQSLDFLVMRIGSNSLPPPLYTHESLPCCAHAFVNPVCGCKRKNPRPTWADRRAKPAKIKLIDKDTAPGAPKSKIQFNGVGGLRTYVSLTASPFQ
jgi:hypothetical protein